MIRKYADRKYLELLPVLIEDKTETSPNYFRIKTCPPILQSGKNLFRILGSQNLEPDTPVLVEILDFNGKNIYYEVSTILETDGSRIISIWIYPETAPGHCTLTLVGTAKVDDANNVLTSEQKKNPNLRWSRSLTVNPNARNNSEIVFNAAPTLQLTEVSRSLFTKTYPGSNRYATVNITSGVQYSYSNQTTILVANSGTFSSAMTNGTVTINHAWFTNLTPNTSVGTETTPVYYATIDRVLSSGAVKLSNPYSIPTSQVSGSHTYTNGHITYMSVTYEQDPILTTVTQSYAITGSLTGSFALSGSAGLLSINNLDPITGDVSRARVYFRKSSDPGITKPFRDYDTPSNYIMVANTVVQSQEILIPASVDKIDLPIGIFTSKNFIDTYWNITSSVALSGTTIGYEWSNSPLINCIHITGSTGAPSTFTNNQYYIISTKNLYSLNSHTTYNITFDTVAELATGFNENGGVQTLDILVSGSGCYDSYLDLNNVKYIGTVNTNGYLYTDNSFDFTIPKDGSVQVMFLLRTGKWHLSNVSLRVRQEVGFTPNKMNLILPIDSYLQETFDVKVEYYDFQNNQAKLISEIKNFTFTKPTILQVNTIIPRNQFQSPGGTYVQGGVITYINFNGTTTLDTLASDAILHQHTLAINSLTTASVALLSGTGINYGSQ